MADAPAAVLSDAAGSSTATRPMMANSERLNINAILPKLDFPRFVALPLNVSLVDGCRE